MCHVNIQNDIGIRHAHRRSFVVPLEKPVGDGILHPVGHKLRVSKDTREHYRINRKSGIEGKIVLPVKLFHRLIDFVRAVSLKIIDGF